MTIDILVCVSSYRFLVHIHPVELHVFCNQPLNDYPLLKESSSKVYVVFLSSALPLPVEMENRELSACQTFTAVGELLQIWMPTLGACGKHQSKVQWHATLVLFGDDLHPAVSFGDDQVMLALDCQQTDLLKTHLTINVLGGWIMDEKGYHLLIVATLMFTLWSGLG